MFWKFDLHMSSQLEALLEKDDVTLTELMEEEDVLQECKAQNRRLLVFLSQDTSMQELLHLITTEPPAGLEETKRFKHPNIACELLTSDVGVINDKLGGEKPLLDTLYSFLEQPPPLNPLLASFFSKTIGNLITRKTEQVVSFLRGKEGFLGLVLNHINTSAMMDLLLRLISCVEPAPLRQDTLNWLNEEQLAQRLIELIHPGKDEEKQSNASQTVCDIIRLSRDQANQLQENSEADPLLAVLESQECVGQLLDNMFVGERTESCIICGTQILLTLLEIRRTGVEGMLDVCVQGHERCVNSSILQAIQPHLTHYHQLLLDPPRVTPMLTSLGVLEVPLGNCRLHVAKLMASLLQTTNTSYYICCNNTIYNNTDLFFKYTWNNFLHFQVELCVAAILSHSAQEQSNILSLSLSLSLHLILEAWEENDKMQAEGGMRRGYMGHLTRIANTVVCSMEKGTVHSQIKLLVDCKGRWETFVDQALTEINKKNTVDLVSHNLRSSSEDDDRQSPFPKELSLQQTFSDYQIQQITANFVDQFSFNDDEFSEHGDNINATFDRIAEINFNVDTEDTAKTAAFEACPGPEYDTPGPGPEYDTPGPGPEYDTPGPGPEYDTPGPGPEYDTPGPGPEYDTPGPGPEYDTPGPGPEYDTPGPGPEYDTPGPGPEYDTPGPGPEYDTPGPGPEYDTPGPGPEYDTPGPGPEYDTPGPEYDTPGPGPEYDTPGPGPEYDTPGPGPEYDTPGPGPEYDTPGPGPEYDTPGPGPEYDTPGPGPEYDTPGPGPEYDTPGPGPEYDTPGPGPEYDTPGPGPEYDTPGPGPEYDTPGPGPEYDTPGPGPEYDTPGPGPEYDTPGPGPGTHTTLSVLLSQVWGVTDVCWSGSE
uniref:Protein phosphatase 6, regulatory subunit 2b n=1 Tax=Salmo trutta TaxID=8032 RepID=A0A674CZ78_SALTR